MRKKCDKNLFYVFPIVIQKRDGNNLFAALAGADENEEALGDDDIKDNLESEETTESTLNEDEDELLAQQQVRYK